MTEMEHRPRAFQHQSVALSHYTLGPRPCSEPFNGFSSPHAAKPKGPHSCRQSHTVVKLLFVLVHAAIVNFQALCVPFLCLGMPPSMALSTGSLPRGTLLRVRCLHPPVPTGLWPQHLPGCVSLASLILYLSHLTVATLCPLRRIPKQALGMLVH